MSGCRWKVGDGTNIQVMGDPWLRVEDGLRIHGPQMQGVYNLTISNLFLPGGRSWDVEKVKNLFPNDMAAVILRVPIFDTVVRDELIWVDDMCGNYSVKSGYNLLLQSTGKIDRLHEEGDWKSLWKVKAPPKTRHLLWRICKECLPTRTRLQGRFVPCPITCPICEQHLEDDWHIFFVFPTSLEAWACVGMENLVSMYTQRYHTVKEVLLNICRCVYGNMVGLFAMTLWELWNNRNNCVWNGVKEAGRAIGTKASVMWHECFNVQLTRNTHNSNVTDQQLLAVAQWQQPPLGWLKCNTDAAFHKDVGKTSMGWCLRDHSGSFIAAGTSWSQGILSIVDGEALALQLAMEEVAQRGFSRVIFETDAKLVTDAIHKSRLGAAEISSLIFSVRQIMSFHSNFQVKFVKRQANMTAHTLF